MLPGVVATLIVVALGAFVPEPLVLDEPLLPELAIGDAGESVATLNQRLTELGFRPDSGDTFGLATRHAVVALQKHHDLDRTGRFDRTMWRLLDEPVAVGWLPQQSRVEIDLDKQLLYLVRDGQLEAILPVSSGNGESYVNSRGNTVRARTPEGTFRFYRHIDGIRVSYLGRLYRPFYFRGGYALHGSSSVPAYPASHGCVRVTNRDMDFLVNHVEVGMDVFVYGVRRDRPKRPEPAPGLRLISF